ncbi:hypothetical protein SNEBB_004199 [Seison nebaliae]|nr:hypothetical protein SNEBB_004199 [Seison nebaliae]
METYISNTLVDSPMSLVTGGGQGYPSSPVIFNVIIRDLLKKLPDEMGAKMNGKKIKSVYLKLLETEAKLMGLQLNKKKCASFGLSGKAKYLRTPEEIKIEIGEETIDEVRGSEINGYLGNSYSILFDDDNNPNSISNNILIFSPIMN